MNRIRYRTVNWAAIMFLIKANRSSTSMARLRQFLILLFRILAVLVLVIAIARPLAGGWLGWTFSGPPETVIILLDRSASMGTEYSTRTSRLKQAKAILASASKGLTGTRFVLLENVNRKACDLASPEILADLSDTAQTQTACDIPSLIDEAVNYVIANKTGVTEIWVASDMQITDWQPENSRWREIESKIKSVPQSLRIRILALDSKVDENMSVRLVKINPPRASDPQEAELVFEINRIASGDTVIPVTFSQGENKKQINVKLTGTSNKFRQKITKGASVAENCGYIELPADSNINDNRAYFTFPVQQEKKTVIVSPDKDVAAEILSIAACPNEKNQGNLKFQQPSAADLIDYKETALIIWAAPFPGEEVQKMLKQFISEGGSIIFFPPETDDPTKLFGSIIWEKCEIRKEAEPLSVKEWDRRSGPFEDTASGESIALNELKIQKTRQLQGYGLNPIASCTDGKPLVSRLKLNGGNAYFCTTLPLQEWSTLGEGQVLVPMIQRILNEGGARLSKTVFSDCGGWDIESMANDIKDTIPSENKNPRFNSGAYRSSDKVMVLNRPPSEDIQEYLGSSDLEEMMKGISFSTLHEKSGTDTNIATEIWKAFLVIMLLFLVSEAFLCLPISLKLKTKKAGF